jgi:Asp-tRNA(Asn)/Glu-tRNA(Gln) amidotransferase A subunit family amidase
VDFRRTTVTALAADVRAGRLSATELTRHALDAIDRHNPAVNAFVDVHGERALREAAAVDQIVASGGDPGPLAGIPLGVKDLEDAAGYRTTQGSPIFGDSPVAAADSPLVSRLRAAGCVVVGKTNTSEMGWSANTTNDLFGPTRNPYNLAHSPGGSSGGSAAAVASGLVPLATGSDGGGSIRIPSSCCGLSGMKPSLGRVPSGGPEAPGWLDLSTKGVMARRMEDVVAALDVVVGPEQSDLRSLPRPEASWPAVLEEPRVPARVAWSPTLGYATIDAEILDICEGALRVLESLGAEIVPVDTVFDEDPVGPWLTMVAACTLRTVAPYCDHPEYERVDPVLRSLVDAARTTTAVDLIKVIDQCHEMNLRLIDLFRGVRLLACPTVAGEPPPLDLEGAGRINGELDYNWVKLTYPFNMTRSPAASVCVGLTARGLPVGLQLIGPQHADLVVLRSAAALEEALGFDELAPLP